MDLILVMKERLKDQSAEVRHLSRRFTISSGLGIAFGVLAVATTPLADAFFARVSGGGSARSSAATSAMVTNAVAGRGGAAAEGELGSGQRSERGFLIASTSTDVTSVAPHVAGAPRRQSRQQKRALSGAAVISDVGVKEEEEGADTFVGAEEEEEEARALVFLNTAISTITTASAALHNVLHGGFSLPSSVNVEEESGDELVHPKNPLLEAPPDRVRQRTNNKNANANVAQDSEAKLRQAFSPQQQQSGGRKGAQSIGGERVVGLKNEERRIDGDAKVELLPTWSHRHITPVVTYAPPYGFAATIGSLFRFLVFQGISAALLLYSISVLMSSRFVCHYYSPSGATRPPGGGGPLMCQLTTYAGACPDPQAYRASSVSGGGGGSGGNGGSFRLAPTSPTSAAAHHVLSPASVSAASGLSAFAGAGGAASSSLVHIILTSSTATHLFLFPLQKIKFQVPFWALFFLQCMAVSKTWSLWVLLFFFVLQQIAFIVRARLLWCIITLATSSLR